MSTVVLNLPISTGGGGGGGDASAANQTLMIAHLQNIKNRLPGSLLSNIDFDDVQQEEPDTETELYKYYNLSVLVATIEIKYFDSSKERLVRFRRI